jgi:hypothetical protein
MLIRPFNLQANTIIGMEREAEQEDLPSTEPPEAACSSEADEPVPPKLGVLGRQKKCRNLFALVAKERLEAGSEGSTAASSPWAID